MQVNAALQDLTQADLVSFYESHICTKGRKRRCVVVCSTSWAHDRVYDADASNVLIKDIGAEKRKLSVHLPTDRQVVAPETSMSFN
jgi:hypothetical protein